MSTPSLSGLVHVVLFASTRRILPPRSFIPKFLISGPRALIASTAVFDGDFDSYYDDAASERSWNPLTAEKKNGAALGELGSPFADPVLPPIDEAMIRSTRTPDSERSLSRASPRAPSPISGDYAGMRAVSASLGTQQWPYQVNGAEVDLDDRSAQISPLPTHREGERMELPQSPLSIHRYYSSTFETA